MQNQLELQENEWADYEEMVREFSVNILHIKECLLQYLLLYFVVLITMLHFHGISR